MNKAYISSIELDGKTYKVRIPEFHKLRGTVGSTSDKELPVASVCTLPGVLPHYHVGDIVFVGYENDDIGEPIILGLLQSNSYELSNLDIAIQCETLDVSSIANLPQSTNIGNIPSINLRYLENIPTLVDNINSNVHLFTQLNVGGESKMKLCWSPIKLKYFEHIETVEEELLTVYYDVKIFNTTTKTYSYKNIDSGSNYEVSGLVENDIVMYAYDK